MTVIDVFTHLSAFFAGGVCMALLAAALTAADETEDHHPWEE